MATNLKTPTAEFGTVVGILKDEKGLMLRGVSAGAPSGGANLVSIGCIVVNTVNGAVYSNTGTVATPSWTLIGTVTAGSVALANLAAGITPSDVPKYSGTITWSGSGASLATTVAGVLSTDRVIASIRVAPTQAAYLVSVAPTTDTITIVLSAANTSNQAQISYEVFRTAA